MFQFRVGCTSHCAEREALLFQFDQILPALSAEEFPNPSTLFQGKRTRIGYLKCRNSPVWLKSKETSPYLNKIKRDLAFGILGNWVLNWKLFVGKWQREAVEQLDREATYPCADLESNLLRKPWDGVKHMLQNFKQIITWYHL